MKKVRWLVDAALVGVLGLFAPTAARGSVDAGVPDAGAVDDTPRALYGAQGCAASGAETGALPGAALAVGALLRRRRKSSER
ncbi:MAG TPA: MYXO-CTERM sorting domain-containing protein [Myxococcales bacterium]|jgi:uncharacterized protein (TIGR03382 family)